MSKQVKKHYYVYCVSKDKRHHVWYERTCGTEDAADSRVKELLAQGYAAAWWSLNNLVAGALL